MRVLRRGGSRRSYCRGHDVRGAACEDAVCDVVLGGKFFE